MKFVYALFISLFITTSAVASTFSSKNVNIIIPLAPGGSSDIIGRKVAMILNEKYPDINFVFKYMPGGNTAIAVNHVLSEKDNDNTFIFSNDDVITGQMSVGSDKYNEFVVTNIIGTSPYMLAMTTRQGVDRNLKGSIQFGTVGANSGPSLWLQSLNLTAPAIFEPVPYKGTPPILVDIRGGTINWAILSSFALNDSITDGVVTPVFVSSDKRIAKHPNVPTFREAGFKGHSDGIYFALYAKKDTNPELLNNINRIIVEAQKNGRFKDLEDKSLTITPLDFKGSNRYYQEVIKQKEKFYKK